MTQRCPPWLTILVGRMMDPEHQSRTSQLDSDESFQPPVPVPNSSLHPPKGGQDRGNYATHRCRFLATLLGLVVLAGTVMLSEWFDFIPWGTGGGASTPISMDELIDHDLEEDCWFAVKGKIYDVTDYANEHPGGSRLITRYCGQDASFPYELEHSDVLLETITELQVGLLVAPESTDAPTRSPTMEPTGSPTGAPTGEPTDKPTSTPTKQPTSSPTAGPTIMPTKAPSPQPTTSQPSMYPTIDASLTPTSGPTSIICGILFKWLLAQESTMPSPSPTESVAKESPVAAVGYITSSPTTAVAGVVATTPPPTPISTQNPTPSPTPQPTQSNVTPEPTRAPTPGPTWAPTPNPTPSPTLVPTSRPTPQPTPRPTSQPTEPLVSCVSSSDVFRHATRGDCWQLLYDRVYDFTDYLDIHPGGIATMLPSCGTDATAEYDREHPIRWLNNMASDYFLGMVCR